MSYLVAKKLGDEGGGDMTSATGVVTIGYNFPDAIGVSALACYEKWPVLLTDHSDGTAMNAYAVQAMNELGITRYVKAGTYAPDPAGITGLGNCSGDDRYYTSANVAIWAKTHAGLTFTHTALTTGDKFPDALAAGPYLAQDHGMLLLSPLDGPAARPLSPLSSSPTRPTVAALHLHRLHRAGDRPGEGAVAVRVLDASMRGTSVGLYGPRRRPRL